MFNQFNDGPAQADVAAPETVVEAVQSENDQEVNQESATDENVESNLEETTADTDNEAGEETESDERKPKRGFAKRIEKFNQKLSAKDAEIEYWRQVALKAAPQDSGVVATPQSSQAKPKFSDFNDIEQYAEALTDWKLQNSMSQVQQQTAMMQTAKTYETRLEQFKQSTRDFDDVMTEFVEDYGNINVPEVVQVAYESEVGPQIAYYLAKNTQEFERIAKLPQHRRLLELGKIEDRIVSQQKSTPVRETKKISEAPKPVQPVKGTGKVESGDLSDPNLSYSEWLKRREATLKRR